MRKWIGLLILASQFACVTQQPEDASAAKIPDKPNIILITVDTLRADRLSCYGYGEITTQHIDEFAEDAVLFDQAISPAPLTLPSHASILTGKYPLSHGVRDNTGFVLPERQSTLPEVLRKKGYKTGAFVGSYVLDSRFGLDQGFDHYFDDFGTGSNEVVRMELSERPAEEVVAAAESWIRSESSGPWFVWMHLFDPHAPYSPPRPYPADSKYDQEVLYVDEQLGRFFDFLKKRGQFEDTLIVLTSDHGEGLGEHGEDTHGMFLYDSTLRVPLVVKPPLRQAGSLRIDLQVRLIDILPTVLSSVGFATPEDIQGVSLLPAWSKGDQPELTAYSEAALPLLNYGWSDTSSLRTLTHKYISAPLPELYDLSSDPGERTNIAEEEPQRISEMAHIRGQLVKQQVGAASAEAYRTPDDETVRRLRSLGYISGSRSPRSARTQDPLDAIRRRLGDNLADPKLKIQHFNRIWRAQTAAVEGDHVKAIQIIDSVLQEDSSIFMAHSIRALSSLELNRNREAVTHLKRAVSLRPEDPGAHLYLGLALIRLDQLEGAAGAFERAIQLDPKGHEARNNLGTVYARLGRFREAVPVFEALARENPADPAPQINLGMVHLMQDEPLLAIQSFEAALERDPNLPEAHNNIGVVHLNTGVPEEAITHFEKAVQLNPRYVNAFENLARAYQQTGRVEQAEKASKAAQRLKELSRR
jgi:arylsulfatase A-like enzyme/Flp pilus assembly protein TadD